MVDLFTDDKVRAGFENLSVAPRMIDACRNCLARHEAEQELYRMLGVDEADSFVAPSGRSYPLGGNR